MSTYLVYLSGPIAGLTYAEDSDWREYVTRCFPPHIQGVSPLRGHRMLENMGPITNGMLEHPLRTDRAINTRNRFDTLQADAVLVNLLGTSRVSIGTVMEIAWAYDHNIPVVVAIEPEGNPHEHPMLRDCASFRVASLDEAIEMATAIVSPHESKIWTRIEQNHMLQEEGRLDLRQEVLKENDGGSLRTH
jgi:nucleoside 2-deoxyribosyltransferase